jgi:hypothetical protein
MIREDNEDEQMEKDLHQELGHEQKLDDLLDQDGFRKKKGGKKSAR